MNKKLLCFMLIISSATFAKAQTPYDDFAPVKSTKKMLQLPATRYKAVNPDPAAAVKYVLFDKENLTLTYFSNTDSAMHTYELNPVEAKWWSIDTLSAKYPNLSPYCFAANNPIRNVDLDGKDIIVLNAPKGAGGYGHLAILIGNDEKGWQLISKEGRDKTPFYSNEFTGGPAATPIDRKFKTLDEFKETILTDKNLKVYTENVRFETSDKQDKDAIDKAREAAYSWYHFYYANCADAVSDALDAAQLNPGYTYRYVGASYAKTGEPTEYLDPVPNVRFKNIKNNNQSIPTY